MDLNSALKNWKTSMPAVPREEKLRGTVEACRESHFRREQSRLSTCWEFLWGQLSFTRKRWWALQAACLSLAYIIIPAMDAAPYRVRSIGVIGCLFVVLMVPELWRNRESDSVQVEAACLYSLRQVYSARITLFGMVDVVLLTLFCLGLGHAGFTWTEVLSQFLLPVTVTASICFWLLCGGQNGSEAMTLAACLAWCGIWCLILLHDHVYTRIVPAVWMGIFGIALGFLGLSIRRAVRTTNQYWEVAYL